jgi:hypothetical protein
MKTSCRSVWRVGRSWRVVCMTLPARGYTHTHTRLSPAERLTKAFLNAPAGVREKNRGIPRYYIRRPFVDQKASSTCVRKGMGPTTPFVCGFKRRRSSASSGSVRNRFDKDPHTWEIRQTTFR